MSLHILKLCQLFTKILSVQDVKVSRRNARERNRVKSVNAGFEVLKRHIPHAAPVKKMSKVNILGHAVEYIESLTLLLQVNRPHSPKPNPKKL